MDRNTVEKAERIDQGDFLAQIFRFAEMDSDDSSLFPQFLIGDLHRIQNERFPFGADIFVSFSSF